MQKQVTYTERELLLQVAEGSTIAFQHLFDLYRNKIYSLGMYLTRSEFLAEEIVQDVFMKVWENREQLAGIQYFNAWLRTVAKNTCCNYLRTMALEKLAMNQLAANTATETASSENEVIARQYEQIIDAAIQQLPAQQKKVYLLSRKAFKKQEEIAHELNISVYTVKEYMKLAQRSIRRYLENRTELVVLTAVVFYLK